MEILAAIAGTYYFKKNSSLRSTRWLVIYLWVTVFVELFCIYSAIAGFSNFKYFSFVKDTPYYDNHWIFNIHIIFSFTFFTYYFGSFLDGRFIRQLVKYLAIAYVIASIGYLITTETYLFELSQFSTIVGTLLLLFVIILFYFQLLKSDKLLNLKYFLPFYVSVGTLIFNLCLTPIDIFSELYAESNSFYVDLKNKAYLFCNIFMYSTFILGFIICRKEKSY